MTFFRFLSSLSAARFGVRVAFAVSLAMAATAPVADDRFSGEATPEYQLKAALLYKLTRFISWPEMAVDENEFTICVLGENVFGNTLEPLKARQANEKNINIEYYDQSDDIDSFCDLLFIEESKAPFLQTILDKFKTRGVLTISDMQDFAKRGGIVELTLVDNKGGFKVNLASAKAAELSIAAPLLQLATIVEGKTGD